MQKMTMPAIFLRLLYFYIIPDNFRMGNRKNARFLSKKYNNSFYDEQCGGFFAAARGEKRRPKVSAFEGAAAIKNMV